MVIRRVAILFDDRSRPETTGVYCRAALEPLVETHHFRPDELDQIPREGFDLYLQIDDGLRYCLPRDRRPSAWWAIDTHLNLPWCLERSAEFDFVFTAQRDGARALRAAGCRTAEWLPLACDPGVHRPHPAAKRYDVSFVGNLFPGPRTDLLALIQARFPQSFVGRCYFQEMAEVYSASRVVFNHSVRNDVNMRVFEALACGSLLMTNDLAGNGQAELFRDGEHLATFREPAELLDKITYYLSHPDEREAIARRGCEEVVARHTYRHRMEELLHKVGAGGGNRCRGTSPGEGTATVKDPTYFDFARPEILQLIPADAQRVLEVGCAAGRLGAALKARQTADYVGIERNPRAADAAQEVLDRVIVADIETLDEPWDWQPFDCIVCGDVLEHLRRPHLTLRRLRAWLAPGGVVVASIPNARHHSVVASLVEGNWTYEPAGLMDETHLRFFTRQDMVELFEFAGLQVRDIRPVPGPGYSDWVAAGRPGEVRTPTLSIGALPPDQAEEFYVYQYLLVAAPVPSSTQGWRSQMAGRARGSRRRAMRFTQDFIQDFEQFDFEGPPFAFARFADGERKVAQGQPLAVPRDGWQYDGRPCRFVDELNAALGYSAPDYYVGISDSCCDGESQQWYLSQLRVPLEQVTFSNIFVNWNYRRFVQLDLEDCVIVGSHGADIPVPADAISSGFDTDELVARLANVDRPILVAAGPASAVIIHKYWQLAPHKQTIVDVGSAIDERLKGRKTRSYQIPGSRTAELVCRW